MPKKYKFYFSFLVNDHDDEATVVGKHLTFDHRYLTDKEIEKAEIKVEDSNPDYFDANVISYDIKSVTGDFTYDVRYEEKSSDSVHQRRTTIVLDHKIVASALDAEYDHFKLVISEEVNRHSFEINVLSFQEIPEE